MKEFLLVLLMPLAASALAAGNDGFVSLFNGRDLAGWENVNCAPETWSVSNAVIHCTGRPTGALRTTRQYENFILELEWRHLRKGGNAGVFIWATPIAAPGVPFLRSIEVQVLDNGFDVPGKNEWYTTHGDVFPIHGSTMKPFGRHNGMRSFPSSERSKPSPDWNHYRIVCTNGVLRLHVNEAEVSGGEDCNHRKGYIGLESEGSPIEFRNIRLKELPSSGASAEQTSPLDRNWRSLFTGLDLRGWRTNAASTQWRVEGERMRFRGTANDAEDVVWTEEQFGDAEFVIDCRPAKPAAGEAAGTPNVFLGAGPGNAKELQLECAAPGTYQRFLIAVSGHEVTVKSNEKLTQQISLPSDGPALRALGLGCSGRAAEFMNIYVTETKREK